MSLQLTSVYVKGLATDADEAAIGKLFDFAGEIRKTIVIKKEDGEGTGNAFITFADVTAAAKAIADVPEGLTASVPTGTQMDQLRSLLTAKPPTGQMDIGALISALLALSPEERRQVSDVLNDDTGSAATGGARDKTKDIKTEPVSPRRAQAGGAAGMQDAQIVIQEQPKLSSFSGEKGKDTTFARWRYDVNCLVASQFSEATILKAIRKSIKTPAADIVRYLGEMATVEEILTKLHSMYGSVLSGESVFTASPKKQLRVVLNGLQESKSCAFWP